MRLNRVLAILGLAVAAGIGLIWVEGQNLRLNQKVSELYRQRELFTEKQAHLRLEVSRLAAPAHVLESLNGLDTPLKEPELPTTTEPRANVPVYLNR